MIVPTGLGSYFAQPSSPCWRKRQPYARHSGAHKQAQRRSNYYSGYCGDCGHRCGSVFCSASVGVSKVAPPVSAEEVWAKCLEIIQRTVGTNIAPVRTFLGAAQPVSLRGDVLTYGCLASFFTSTLKSISLRLSSKPYGAFSEPKHA